MSIHSKLNLPVVPPTEPFIRSNEQIQIGLAGILHATKGLSHFLEMATSNQLAHCRFQLFGHDNYLSAAERNQIAETAAIEFESNLSEFEFQTRLKSLNILINYRSTYYGESSYATLEAMRHGVAVVVRDIGWYAELPDEVVIKVQSPDQIQQAVQRLVSRPDELETISRSAMEYVQEHHSFQKYAHDLVAFLQQKKQSPGRSATKAA